MFGEESIPLESICRFVSWIWMPVIIQRLEKVLVCMLLCTIVLCSFLLPLLLKCSNMNDCTCLGFTYLSFISSKQYQLFFFMIGSCIEDLASKLSGSLFNLILPAMDDLNLMLMTFVLFFSSWIYLFFFSFYKSFFFPD